MFEGFEYFPLCLVLVRGKLSHKFMGGWCCGSLAAGCCAAAVMV